MTDPQLTAALARLGLDHTNYAAVALLPLIEVAWADGRIQRAERRLIGRIAETYGMSVPSVWLDRWLVRRPSATAFLTARTVLLGLMHRSDDPVDVLRTRDSLLELCQRVAEVAGGLFGVAFAVSRSERSCIAEIARHLCPGPVLDGALAARPARLHTPDFETTRVQRFRRPQRAISLGAEPTRLRRYSRPPVTPEGTLTMPRFDRD